MGNKDLKAVYVLVEPNRGYVKVGISQTPEERFKSINNLAGIKVKLIYRTSMIYNAKVIEDMVLTHFKENNFSGEWLDADVTDVVEYLKSLSKFYDNEDYTPLSKLWVEPNTEVVKEKTVLEPKRNLIETDIEGLYRDEVFNFYVYYSMQNEIQEVTFNVYKTAKEFRKDTRNRVIYTDML